MWWLYVWLVLVVYSLFLQMIYPAVVIAAVQQVRRSRTRRSPAASSRCSARSGFRSRGLFVMDGSKRSSHGNAFFAGFGAAKRIVLFDTLVARLQPAEVEAVLAHELGHFKLRHIVKGMALTWAFSFALAARPGLLPTSLVLPGPRRATATPPIALLLFMLVVPVFTFFVQPLLALFSRKNEFEADALRRQPMPMRRTCAARWSSSTRTTPPTLTPDPLHSAYYDSHPPAAMRIARLRTA